MTERGKVMAALVAEVSFAVLPLLVVLMVRVNADDAAAVFASPEWVFGAAILFGQALVKFVVGLARGGSAAAGPVALAVAVVIVFGLAPSLMTLSMTLRAEIHATQASQHTVTGPAPWLQVLHVVLFVGAIIGYLILGTVGELWRRE